MSQLSVLLRAAKLWADATKGGNPRNDAYLIIAATALTADRILLTSNRLSDHCSRGYPGEVTIGQPALVG